MCSRTIATRGWRKPGGFDPGFQGLGLARSDAAGALRFRTIRPVAYPGRTPHIHVKVRHASFGELTTQVEGDPGNARDFLWRQLPEADRAPLAMQLQPAPAGSDLRWLVQHTSHPPARCHLPAHSSGRVNVCLFGVAARRDCPFHPMRGVARSGWLFGSRLAPQPDSLRWATGLRRSLTEHPGSGNPD
jgi:hypothetical protein